MGSRRLLTPAEKAAIEAVLRRNPPVTVPVAGKLCKELGERFDRKPTVIMMFAQRQGWIPKAPKQRIKPEHIETIRKGVEEDKSWSGIGKETGFHPGTCQSIARKYGFVAGKNRPHVWAHEECTRCGIRKHWPGARYLCTGITV